MAKVATPTVVDIDDPLDQSGELLGERNTRLFWKKDPEFEWSPLRTSGRR